MMRHPFQCLLLWKDPVARDGPGQMACDEALLNLSDQPVLRIFQWAAPWVSAGYFTPLALAKRVRPDLPVCRRWTGGGIVIHEGDFTFSLVVPADEPLARMRPAESYRQIHETLAAAMALQGMDAALAPGGGPAGGECFVSPVAHDVVSSGRKVAGGAQRRTRRGLLHQGSIQGIATGLDFERTLAGLLSREVRIHEPHSALPDAISRLLREKYDTPDFLQGRQNRKNFTDGRAG